MNKAIVTRNTIIQLLIITVTLLFIVKIWPLGSVVNHFESKQQAITDVSAIQGESFTREDKKLQTVVFKMDHIYKIKLYMSCIDRSYKDVLIFRLYDDSFSAIYEEEYGCKRIKNEGYLVATPDMDVIIGKNYYYEILVHEDCKAIIGLPIANDTDLLQEENSVLYIDGIYNDTQSLVADFEYTQPLSVLWTIAYILLILVCGVATYAGVFLLLKKYDECSNKDVVVKTFKIVMTGLLIIAVIVAFVFSVIMNGFGGDIADRVVYALGIIVALALGMCAIWLNSTHKKVKMLDEGAVSRHKALVCRNYIQTVCFGLLIYSLCNYVNADRQYLQYVNTRWMLIFLGLAFLVIQTKKQLCNVYSYIWLALSFIGSVIYCRWFTQAEDIDIARLSCAVVVVWGLTIINVMLYFKIDAFKRISIPYFIIWMIFNICMYIYRYNNTWIYVATLPFAVLLFYNLDIVKKTRLISNFSNGLLLSFGLVVLNSLVHRPYHFWIMYRYPMMFHTVACTGLYLALVFAVALGRLYVKWKQDDLLFTKCWFELFVTALAMDFILLCMARTALMAVGGCVLVVSIVTWIYYKKRFVRVIKEGLVLFGVIIACFPFVFTTVRIVPALCNDPYYFTVERQGYEFTIREYDYIDSTKYMTIERYYRLFINRLAQSSYDTVHNIDIENEILVASNSDSLSVNTEYEEDERNYGLEANSDRTNGRFDIYKAYWSSLTWSGHEDIQCEKTDAMHAHNSYLQVAYSFGIFAGIVFLILCGYTFINSILLYFKHGKKHSAFIVPLMIITCFGVVSITEWVFHPCYSVGFSFMLMSSLQLQKHDKRV